MLTTPEELNKQLRAIHMSLSDKLREECVNADIEFLRKIQHETLEEAAKRCETADVNSYGNEYTFIGDFFAAEIRD